MPAQKRPLETASPPLSPLPSPKEEKPDDSLNDSDNQNQKQTENGSDSDESSSDSDGEKDECIVVRLAEIRKEVQCPICLGIIRKTRTVMECLHRFCRECIDKSMRLGNNECPACRTHCASRRSLRDDPNYDALIAALYPDLDKYEEEELAFHEEEKARNKQIQASISQTFRRQAEALGKKRTSARGAAAFIRRQGTYRNLRGRRNHQVAENQGSDEEEGANGNDGSKDSSSADERSAEAKSKRYKRWRRTRTSGANANGGCDYNDSENEEELHVGITEIPAWGRGGMRSNTRHGGLSWVNGRISRTKRISKLVDHLQCSKENEEEKINLTLVSLLEEKIPSLKRPYLCCSSKSTIRHICQYVGMQASMEASEVEILIRKDFHAVNGSSSLESKSGILNPCNNELQLLNEHQTLGEIYGSFTQQNLVFAYRQKARVIGNGPKVEAADNGPKVEDAGNRPKVEAAGDGLKVEAAGDGPKVEAAGDGPKVEAAGDGPKVEAAGDGPKVESADI